MRKKTMQQGREKKPFLARRVAKTIMLVRSISSLTGGSCGATDDIVTLIAGLDFSLPNQIHFTLFWGESLEKIVN